MEFLSARTSPRSLGIGLALMLFSLALALAWWGNHDRMHEILQHGSDPWGYYQFLPALLGTHAFDALPWAVELENGRSLSVFSIGVALLQLPFFLGATLMAWINGHPADGYSCPYAWARLVAAAFYLAIGCTLVFHVLRRWFTTHIALLTPVVLFVTTNLWFYTGYDAGMSHVYSFFLFAWLLHLTIGMVERPSGGTLFWLFVCAALIILVRQLNAIALLVPLFFGTAPRRAIQERIAWLTGFPRAAVAGLVVALLLIVPQIVYWHHITGDLIVFTYGKKGEGFDWLHPCLGNVLFSHQNGWFIYSPIMLPVMIALITGAWKGRPGFRITLLVWALAWYTYASWWNWWLGGAFGHRGFVEHYAFLAPALAVLLDALWRARPGIRLIGTLLIALCAFLNFRMSMLYNSPWDGPDWTWSRVFDVWAKAFFA